MYHVLYARSTLVVYFAYTHVFYKFLRDFVCILLGVLEYAYAYYTRVYYAYELVLCVHVYDSFYA